MLFFASLLASTMIASKSVLLFSGKTRHSVLNLLAIISTLCFLAIVVVEATDEVGTKFLEEKSKEPGVVTLPSGLRYKVLEKGTGSFHPKVDSPCLCHYGEFRTLVTFLDQENKPMICTVSGGICGICTLSKLKLRSFNVSSVH